MGAPKLFETLATSFPAAFILHENVVRPELTQSGLALRLAIGNPLTDTFGKNAPTFGIAGSKWLRSKLHISFTRRNQNVDLWDVEEWSWTRINRDEDSRKTANGLLGRIGPVPISADLSLISRQMTVFQDMERGPLSYQLTLWITLGIFPAFLFLASALFGDYQTGAIMGGGAAVFIAALCGIVHLCFRPKLKELDQDVDRLAALGFPHAALTELLVEGDASATDTRKLTHVWIELQKLAGDLPVAVRWQNDTLYFYVYAGNGWAESWFQPGREALAVRICEYLLAEFPRSDAG